MISHEAWLWYILRAVIAMAIERATSHIENERWDIDTIHWCHRGRKRRSISAVSSGHIITGNTRLIIKPKDAQNPNSGRGCSIGQKAGITKAMVKETALLLDRWNYYHNIRDMTNQTVLQESWKPKRVNYAVVIVQNWKFTKWRNLKVSKGTVSGKNLC